MKTKQLLNDLATGLLRDIDNPKADITALIERSRQLVELARLQHRETQQTEWRAEAHHRN